MAELLKLYILHFNEEILVKIFYKNYKCVSLEVHYKAITLNEVMTLKFTTVVQSLLILLKYQHDTYIQL